MYPFVATSKDGKKVCIAQAWQFYSVLGKLDATFDGNGDILGCGGKPTLLLVENFFKKENDKSVLLSEKESNALKKTILKNPNLEIIGENATVVEKLKPFKKQVLLEKNKVIAFASKQIKHSKTPSKNKNLPLGSDIVPLVSKALHVSSKPSDVAITNGGGVSTHIQKGDISMGTVMEILPHNNTLVEIKMYGAEIKQVLEDALSKVYDDGVYGAFPYAYALKYDIDTTRGKNNRILNLEIKDRQNGAWSAVDNAQMYTIATSSYLASGKDGYTTFKSVQDSRGDGLNTYLSHMLSFVKYIEEEAKNGKTISKLPKEEHPIKSFK